LYCILFYICVITFFCVSVLIPLATVKSLVTLPSSSTANFYCLWMCLFVISDYLST